MLENLSKVLVVDNEVRELEHISIALSRLNIPAYYSLYSQIRPPEKPFTGIRLAFFDIKLHDGNHDDKLTINSFVNALKQNIDLNNGPFILIFWTSHTDIIEKIKKFINSRVKGSVPTPILVDCIDKDKTGDPEQLIASINEKLSNETLEILFDYESKVSQAAGKTLKTIFDVISNGKDTWGESKHFEENFDLVFSNIAFETYGFKNAKKNPVEAVRDGLSPILINELNNITLSANWINKLKKLLDSGEKSEFEKIEQQHVCQLNSIYHIDFNNEKTSKVDRGVVVEFKITEELMVSIFGKETNQIRHTYLPFNSATLDKIEKKRIINASKFVLLEISAACDFAQNNHRNYTFILGLLTPAFDLRILMKQSDSIISTPFFSYQNSDYILFLNSRYTFNCPDENCELLGNILFTLKIELLNKITTQYSSYISRLGVIQF